MIRRHCCLRIQIDDRLFYVLISHPPARPFVLLVVGRRETLFRCKWNPLTLNIYYICSRVHLLHGSYPTHYTFILSLERLKRKIIKVYRHTFYPRTPTLTDKFFFFFRTIEITVKLLKRYAPGDPLSARLKLSIYVRACIFSSYRQIVMYFLGAEKKKKKVRSITGAIRVNCFPYYMYDQRSHEFFDERLLCPKKKKIHKKTYTELLDEAYSTKYMIYTQRYNVRQLVFRR